jgi:hypothetical protein
MAWMDTFVVLFNAILVLLLEPIVIGLTPAFGAGL